MHCSREELIRWALAGSVGDKGGKAHLADCGECRQLLELFVAFAGAAGAPLASAPSGWVERACAIAGSSWPKTLLKKVGAALVFDSWQAPAVAGLRGVADTESRRLRWEAGEWLLDLRAETSREGWDLVAQVQREGEAKAGVAVGFGARKVYTDNAGMAVWSTRRPPRTISLHTQEGILRCGEIAWSRPKRS